MIYIADASGTIKRVINGTVNQNSNLANEVILLAPFPNAQVTVAFTLPNGVHTTESVATPNMAEFDLDGIIESASGDEYGLWQFLLPSAVTAIAGQVQVQFYIYLGSGAKLTTSPTFFNVQKGVPSILPEEPTPSVYAQILEELTRITAELGAGEITLVKVTALPTENISSTAIYQLTYNGLIYYFLYVSGLWVQLNSSYLYVNAMQEGQAPTVNVYGKNTIYAVISNGKTTLYYVGANNVVRRILNDLDYAQVVESLTAINQSITETTELANTAQASATQASALATQAQTTANTAQNTAQQALNKANSVSSAFRPQGSVSTITSMAQPSSTTIGYVYNITQSFTTTSQFVEGAGKTYPAGTNVAIIQQGSSYYYDVFVGFVDLSQYQTLLVSGTNIKTINNQSLLGSGNIPIKEIISTAPIYNTGADIPVTVNSNGTAYVRLQIYTGENDNNLPTGFNVTYTGMYYPYMPSVVSITLTFNDGRIEEYFFTNNETSGVFPSDWQAQTGSEPYEGANNNGYTWNNVVSVNIATSPGEYAIGTPYLEINGTNVGSSYTADLTENITFSNEGGEF